TSVERLLVAGDGLKRFKSSAELFAVIYTPMMIQGKPIGVLTVGNHRKRRVFDEGLTSLMEMLTGYAAIAISNARLFNAVQARARSMEQAYEELKSRSGNQVTALRQPLLDLQGDIRTLGASGLPHKFNDQVNGLHRK